MIADVHVDTPETVAIGGGAHGVELLLPGVDLLRYLEADVADIARPR